ncbi:uncharacterized protein LOC123292595 [Chrysoperla carnea]|uniref:uncharacterized protein LOC123292595 n=1 Tax=Chrysoperla carnea TaxID=189513 RepID=UPI001D05EAD3|nr:uncharacterized protein LOC123292595 [Chrysoperla carnea]
MTPFLFCIVVMIYLLLVVEEMYCQNITEEQETFTEDSTDLFPEGRRFIIVPKDSESHKTIDRKTGGGGDSKIHKMFPNSSESRRGQRLHCYQCESKTVDFEFDPCGAQFWKYNIEAAKVGYDVECANGTDTFCVKMIINEGSATTTRRGCSGPTDDDDNEIQIGCITVIAHLDTMLCVCRDNLCNFSERLQKPINAIIIHVIVLSSTLSSLLVW